MYIALCVATLFFVFFLNKARIRYRKRDYKEPKLFHGALVLLINFAFEVAYRKIYTFQPTQVQGVSIFLTYWLPQVIFYLCLITVLMAISCKCGLFIWPDVKNKINEGTFRYIHVCFFLAVCTFYPSLMRNGLAESSFYMLFFSVITGGLISIYCLRMLVIKFNK